MKKTLLSAILIIVFGLGIFVVLEMKSSAVDAYAPDRTFSFTASKWLATDLGDSAAHITEKTDVRKVSDLLAGKYEGSRYIDVDVFHSGTYIAALSPGYTGGEMDIYAPSSYPDIEDGKKVVYGEAFFVLNDHEIALWNEGVNKYWVGKRAEAIDTEYLEALLKSGGEVS